MKKRGSKPPTDRHASARTSTQAAVNHGRPASRETARASDPCAQPLASKGLRIFCNASPTTPRAGDQENWRNISWPEGGGSGFKSGRMDLDLAGPRTLYVKFHQTSPARTALKYFHLHVRFRQEPEEVDKGMKQRLKSLGYVD